MDKSIELFYEYQKGKKNSLTLEEIQRRVERQEDAIRKLARFERTYDTQLWFDDYMDLISENIDADRDVKSSGYSEFIHDNFAKLYGVNGICRGS
jgi:hypothetical protein